jgi:hypothetical protein
MAPSGKRTLSSATTMRVQGNQTARHTADYETGLASIIARFG